VAQRVVEQVLDGAGEPLGVAPHPHARRGVDPQGHAGRCDAHRHVADDRAEVHHLPARRRAAVEPGGGQEVLDHPAQAQGVVEHALRGRPPARGVGVAQGHLELGPHASQRAAELVGGVGHEGALAAAGLLEPVEHAVERNPEPVDLIVGGGQGQAPRGARARDLLGALAQCAHRAQGRADGDPGDRGEQREQQRDADQQGGLHDADAVGHAGH